MCAKAWGHQITLSMLVLEVLGVAPYSKFAESCSRCFYRPLPWSLTCVFFFSDNPHFAHTDPTKSWTTSKIFNRLVIALKVKSKFLSMALRGPPIPPCPLPSQTPGLLLPRPHPFWSSCLSSYASACKPRLDLCKSNIHPPRLSSNISSWRHSVAFCQFEFLLNNCYCKINDRRQSVLTARSIFFFTAALITESRKSHFSSSTYYGDHTELSPYTVF